MFAPVVYNNRDNSFYRFFFDETEAPPDFTITPILSTLEDTLERYPPTSATQLDYGL